MKIQPDIRLVPYCPINLECEQVADLAVDDDNKYYCQNSQYCRGLSLSWEVPYNYDYLDDGTHVMTIKEYGSFYKWFLTKNYWHEEAHEDIAHCPIPSGYYYASDTDLPNVTEEVIVKAWRSEGFFPACDIKDWINPEFYRHDRLSEIPF